MIQATCIQKFKKNNKIYGYRLQDSQGSIKDVYADQLKTSIKNKQIEIKNLTLTSDNRLIDTTIKQSKLQEPKISNEKQKIKDIMAKAKLLGLPIQELPTSCNHRCYLISVSETEHIVCIPDDVTKMNEYDSIFPFTDTIQEIQGTLKIIGGHNIEDANNMFKNCQVQSLDLSSFDTSNVTDMRSMFCECEAQSLNLSSFNTSKVIYMGYMFSRCEAQSINLSSFDTSKVTDMRSMFWGCSAQYLDLSSFNISKVTDIRYMFDNCHTKIKATDPNILAAYNNK